MRALTTLLLVPLLFSSCRGLGAAPPEGVAHVVLFELQDPERTGELVSALEDLVAVTPGVVDARVGPRADVNVREGLTDVDFDVLFWIHFDSPMAYDAYEISPPHVELVERFTPLLSGVRVFDAWTGKR